MSVTRTFLLFAFVCAALAGHTRYYRGHRFDDDDDEEHHDGGRGYDHHDEDYEEDAQDAVKDVERDGEYDEDTDDDSILKGASSSYSSRRVVWRGPSSYPGYKYSRKQPPPRPSAPPRTVPGNYVYRQTARPSHTPITTPLHNKQRANDPRYRQGLQELRDLM